MTWHFCMKDNMTIRLRCDCELAITRTEDTEHRDDFLLVTGHHNVRMIAQTNVSNSTG